MGLRGTLKDLTLADLIQMQCQAGGTSVLRVQRGPETGLVYFAEGQVMHARVGDASGAEAVYALLTWDEGEFEVEAAPAELPERNVTLPWTALIMEGMRRWDEARAAQHSSSSERKEQPMAEETRRDKLTRILRTLVDTSGDINGVALVSLDGLIMAASLPADVEQARVGAVAAAILNLSNRSIAQLKRGALRQVTLQGDDGYVIITNAGANAVLVGLTGKDVNLGMAFLEMRDCADGVARTLA